MHDGNIELLVVAAGLVVLAAVLLLEGLAIAGNRSAVTYREPSTTMMSLHFRY
jgi:hypothetical protein